MPWGTWDQADTRGRASGYKLPLAPPAPFYQQRNQPLSFMLFPSATNEQLLSPLSTGSVLGPYWARKKVWEVVVLGKYLRMLLIYLCVCL